MCESWLLCRWPSPESLGLKRRLGIGRGDLGYVEVHVGGLESGRLGPLERGPRCCFRRARCPLLLEVSHRVPQIAQPMHSRLVASPKWKDLGEVERSEDQIIQIV
jgi:hypothetical protein